MKKPIMGLFLLTVFCLTGIPVEATDSYHFISDTVYTDSSICAAEKYRLSGIQRVPLFKTSHRLMPSEATNHTGTEFLSGVKPFQSDPTILRFMTTLGTVDIGYVRARDAWGTGFGSTSKSGPRIIVTPAESPVSLVFFTEKTMEQTSDPILPFTADDRYAAGAVYRDEEIEGGMLYTLVIDNGDERVRSGSRTRYHILSPYFKASMGPTYLEGQVNYAWGTVQNDLERKISVGYAESDIASYSWYLKAKYDLGQSFVGAMYAFVRGDDPDTDNVEGVLTGGNGWDPCLILWNDALDHWGKEYGFSPDEDVEISMTNASLYQLFFGTSPFDELTLTASYTFARVNEKKGRLNADYGQEIDVTATYKLYDNLDYMIGFGYLMAGEPTKDAGISNEGNDDYLLLNKLTVNF
ncbi:MAG: hypothetical protein JXO48_01230 [Deltaproteobacteria bacterium]|nr:hypothetical protein [Deltaproteobacteria bacterium]